MHPELYRTKTEKFLIKSLQLNAFDKFSKFFDRSCFILIEKKLTQLTILMPM